MRSGKCNSSSQPARGGGGEGDEGEEVPGLSGTKCGIGGSHHEDPGARGSEAGSSRRGARRGRGAGAHLCGPPAAARPPARPLASPSEAPEISVVSACGNVVWRKVAPRPRSCSSPSGSPTSLPRPPPPRPPPALPAAPLLGRGARWLARRNKLGRASRSLWEETGGHGDGRQHPLLGPGAQELPGRPDPRGLAGRGASSSGRGENLPQCLEQRLQRGRRRRPPSAAACS